MRFSFALVSLILCCARAGADEGFRDIFDGKSLDGWVVEGTKTLKVDDKEQPVWTVDDGMVHCAGKGFGFLRYDKPLKDFVLKLEYKVNKGGNSGIGIRTVPFQGKADTRPSKAGYEIQILDDAGKAPGKGSSGSLYRYVAPAANATKSSPEWNAIEIECRGPKIRVTLNGRVLHDLDQTTIEEIKNKPLEGSICLQNHGSKAWFRNVRLKAE